MLHRLHLGLHRRAQRDRDAAPGGGRSGRLAAGRRRRGLAHAAVHDLELRRFLSGDVRNLGPRRDPGAGARGQPCGSTRHLAAAAARTDRAAVSALSGAAAIGRGPRSGRSRRPAVPTTHSDRRIAPWSGWRSPGVLRGSSGRRDHEPTATARPRDHLAHADRLECLVARPSGHRDADRGRNRPSPERVRAAGADRRGRGRSTSAATRRARLPPSPRSTAERFLPDPHSAGTARASIARAIRRGSPTTGSSSSSAGAITRSKCWAIASSWAEIEAAIAGVPDIAEGGHAARPGWRAATDRAWSPGRIPSPRSNG